MRRMLKRFSGPILSDDELPPTAPQPSVKAGTRFVVAPIPPSAPGVLTKRRETGFFSANSRIIALSSEWIISVCPAPS